jgi:hypothetical protein
MDAGTGGIGTGGSGTGGSGTGGTGQAGAGGSNTGGVNSGGTSTGGGVATGGAASGGVSGSGGTASGGRDAGSDSGTDAGSSVCVHPTPRLGPDGKPTGFVNCDGGFSHRTKKLECATALPRSGECGSGHVTDASIAYGACATDSDCKDQPNGYCNPSALGGGCSCNYGCRTDADCGTGEICGCGDPIGQCVPTANCTIDADCGAGFLCITSGDGFCGETFACQTAQDTCLTDADCTTDMPLCAYVTDHHECAPRRPCGTGRPFLVGGEARVANVTTTDTWRSDLRPQLAGLEVAARERLAEAWTDVALMEHASIAAFARFTLELLSLGAPPALVLEAQTALLDETIHARDAFALASAYAGRGIGPGPLDVGLALGSRSPLDVVRTAILEGCIGETVAAVEATEALAHATDLAVRTALARVATDEARHAELAWRFVKWALESGPESLRDETARALASIVDSETHSRQEAARNAPHAALDAIVVGHGVLDGERRAELGRRIMLDVIQPCARALLAASDSHEPSMMPARPLPPPKKGADCGNENGRQRRSRSRRGARRSTD